MNGINSQCPCTYDVLDVGFFEVLLQLPPEVQTDVLEDGVATGILPRAITVIQEILEGEGKMVLNLD